MFETLADLPWNERLAFMRQAATEHGVRDWHCTPLERLLGPEFAEPK